MYHANCPTQGSETCLYAVEKFFDNQDFIVGGNVMLSINKKFEDEKLYVALEGRLDTTTSPELEKQLSESLPGVKELVLDLEKLEYISSAGLRVLLTAQKTMTKQGSMKLIHVNDLVMEILEVTGFVDILTIE